MESTHHGYSLAFIYMLLLMECNMNAYGMMMEWWTEWVNTGRPSYQGFDGLPGCPDPPAVYVFSNQNASRSLDPRIGGSVVGPGGLKGLHGLSQWGGAPVCRRQRPFSWGNEKGSINEHENSKMIVIVNLIVNVPHTFTVHPCASWMWQLLFDNATTAQSGVAGKRSD